MFRALRGVRKPLSVAQSNVRYSSSSAVVKVSYNDLVSNCVDLSAQIDEAFNYNGFGLIAVSDVPELMTKRKTLLKKGFEFANLPDSVKNQYEHEKSYFSVGWSHGKELFQGVPDFSKGSWYCNPKVETPTTDPELISKFPSYFTPNIWPAEVPSMQAAFSDLGMLICDTGVLLAKHCDNFVAQSLGDAYKARQLEETLINSTVPKGRLLHYYPQEPQEKSGDARDFSSWCGWHNDHGALTGLTSAMFMNAQGEELDNPDPSSGLYVKTRTGETKHIKIPRDCLGFQIGEAAQIMTGGVLQATPHAVMGPSSVESAGISRTTLAVFMQPMPETKLILPNGRSREDVERGSTAEFMPPGTPELAIRWDPQIEFGTFTNRTLEHYH